MGNRHHPFTDRRGRGSILIINTLCRFVIFPFFVNFCVFLSIFKHFVIYCISMFYKGVFY